MLVTLYHADRFGVNKLILRCITESCGGSVVHAVVHESQIHSLRQACTVLALKVDLMKGHRLSGIWLTTVRHGV